MVEVDSGGAWEPRCGRHGASESRDGQVAHGMAQLRGATLIGAAPVTTIHDGSDRIGLAGWPTTKNKISPR